MSFIDHLFESKNTYQGKEVTLNKPFRTPDGPKKFSVYVKNDKGNVLKVNFGDSDMKIKRDSDDRRSSFRARHNCDSPGPKWKARYWSCRMWEKNTSVSDLTEMAISLDESGNESQVITSVDNIFEQLVDGTLRVNINKIDENWNSYETLKKYSNMQTEDNADALLLYKINALVDYIVENGEE